MDKVTQQNAANAEESASSSEELSSQAEELQGMVSQFRIRSTGQVINQGRPVHAKRTALPPPRGEKNGVHLVGASQLIPLDNEGLKEF
jgi:methyl-accepting chemotaxis protein